MEGEDQSKCLEMHYLGQKTIRTLSPSQVACSSSQQSKEEGPDVGEQESIGFHAKVVLHLDWSSPFNP